MKIYFFRCDQCGENEPCHCRLQVTDEYENDLAFCPMNGHPAPWKLIDTHSEED